MFLVHRILVTLIKKALSSSETSILTRTTRRNIPEDAILLINISSTSAGNFCVFIVQISGTEVQTVGAYNLFLRLLSETTERLRIKSDIVR
jgi:hypothetical protein